MAVPVSVFIITRNEAARIGRTLAAVAWADQVVVVDSGSSDGTQDIARAAGAEVHHRDWDGYGPQKRFAEGLCRHDWRLNVDADEVVTADLAAEIAALLAAAPPPAAYRVRILNVYPGCTRPRPLANDYDVVRFYHRTAGAYRDHALFDRVELAPGHRLRRLRAPIHHFALVSWHHMIEKENAYTSFQARTARPKSRAWLLLRLPIEAPVVFLKTYLLRRHFTGGWKGFAFSVTVGFVRMLRIVKMLEQSDIERAGTGTPSEAAGKK